MFLCFVCQTLQGSRDFELPLQSVNSTHTVSLIKHHVTESFVGAVVCILCTSTINAVFLLFPHIISCLGFDSNRTMVKYIYITELSHNRQAFKARFIHPLGLCCVETEGWRGMLCSCVGIFLTRVLTDLKQRIPERADLRVHGWEWYNFSSW